MEPSKKRGRPKGSKNKPKEFGEATAGNNDPVSNIHFPKQASSKPEPVKRAAKSTAATSFRNYTPLAKTSLGNTDLYNLYGIVIDASSPHPKKNFFRQLLKIVDPSMHYKQPRDPSDPNNGCVSVTFFAHQQESLPTFMRVGDIIRIHRANIGTYKNYKTFSVNLAFGSSWVIFSGFEDSLPPKCSAEKKSEESKISPIKDFYNTSNKTVTSEADESGVVRKVTPYKSSSKDYSLSTVDADIVTRYRTWLAEYFQNEFNYEATLFMNLSKVREFIFSEGSNQNNSGLQQKQPVPQFNHPREYDLVVRIDEISSVDEDLAVKVMTGGKHPLINVVMDATNTVQARQREGSKCIKISDTASITFELWVPDSMVPEKIKIGDVIRIKSVVASTSTDHKTVLVPTDHSNLLQIHKSFKLYQRFHKKIENTEYDLSVAILGQAGTKPPQFVRNSDDGGQTVSLKINSATQAVVGQQQAGSNLIYNPANDMVLEKPDTVSNVGTMYKNFLTIPLAEVLFSNPDDGQRFQSDGREEQGMQQAFLEKNTYRVSFCVLGVQPLNLYEVCQLYCSQCHKNFSFKTLQLQANPTSTCQECGTSQLEPIYCLQLLAQDMSLIHYADSISKRRQTASNDANAEEAKSQASVDLVRVLLYTNGGLCNKFFNGIAATNLYRENTTRLMIERYIRHICRFNVYLDAIVEKCEVPALQGKTLNGVPAIQNNVQSRMPAQNDKKTTVLRLVSCRLKPL